MDKIKNFSFKAKKVDFEKVKIIDKILIKGLGIDRSTNDTNMDYARVNKFEPKGLRIFVHKYNLGMQDYYYQKLHSDLIASCTKEAFTKDYESAYLSENEMRVKSYELKKDMESKTHRYVLRVTVQMLDNSIGDY